MHFWRVNTRIKEYQKVIVTSHSGSHTDNAVNQMGWMSIEDCLDVMRNQPPPEIVNPQVIPE